MTISSNFLALHWVNVVILAEFHNPSILNPDFLKGKKVVPQDWQVAENLITPAFASVKFVAGVSFFVDRERLEIKQECGGDFLENYYIYDLASKYVKLLPYVRYTTMGLNWQVSIEKEEPEKYITNTFVNCKPFRDSRLDILSSSVNISFEVRNTLCNLNLVPGRAKVASREYSAVIANVNFHHKGPFSHQEINRRVKQWRAREDYIRKMLPKLLTEV
ncbi:MAG: hypothetical protein HY788_21325 [Deltaproteobacteria bacterium]|nr:hypothetical protein [Deltaproteobacteria bacterium]